MTLVEQGVINGYPDGTYNPGGQVTRAEFLKLIGTASEGEEYFEKQKVVTENWYEPYVNWGFENGYTMTGVEEDDVNAAVTREEMAVVLARVILDKELEDEEIAEDVYIGDETEDREYFGSVEFKDINELSESNRLFINIISEIGLINGYEDETFRPNNYMSRAEVATVIYRFLSLK